MQLRHGSGRRQPAKLSHLTDLADVTELSDGPLRLSHRQNSTCNAFAKKKDKPTSSVHRTRKGEAKAMQFCLLYSWLFGRFSSLRRSLTSFQCQSASLNASSYSFLLIVVSSSRSMCGRILRSLRAAERRYAGMAGHECGRIKLFPRAVSH